MVTVPSFILRRLYVKGSLLATDQGVEFQLLNKLGSGYAKRIMPLVIDGIEIPIEKCSFHVTNSKTLFEDITDEKPFTIALNQITTVALHDVELIDGPHKIIMAFEVPGLGILKFDFVDTLLND